MDMYAIEGYWTWGHEHASGLMWEGSAENLPDGYSDEDIMFYGLTQPELAESIDSGEPLPGMDFVVTGYQRVQA